jgi:mRNA m6A methyltransferase catalytic subunit
MKKYDTLFDVILADPPWFVKEDLRYPCLTLNEIFSIPFHVLQTNGFVMIWVLIRTEEETRKRMNALGYKYKDKIIWEKTTPRGNPINGNGWITRHSTETLLIFQKGCVSRIAKYHRAFELVRAPMRGESIKPEEVITEILKLVPKGHYLEIFARKNNLRPNFVSVGNMLR